MELINPLSPPLKKGEAKSSFASTSINKETLILKDEHLDPKQRQFYLQVAIKHCERLNKLVTGLFDLAKLDAGDTRLNLDNAVDHKNC